VITDYASLQSTIADYLGRSDLTTQIQTFINQAESRIYQNLRVAPMEKAIALTVSATGSAAVPSDYIAMRELYLLDVNGQPYQQMERTTPFWIHQNFNATNSQGDPYYFAREGTNFIFAPWQSANTSLGGIYWARLPSLSVTNTTNWLTSSNPNLILTGALLEAATYLDDQPGVQYWTSRFEQSQADAQSTDDLERMSGSPPVMRRG